MLIPMAGMFKRIAAIFQAKANKVLDKAEDPRDTLDLSYEKQLQQLQKVRRGVADVATARKRLELQAQGLQKQADKLQAQAKAKEKETADELAASEMAIERHHRLSYATGTVQLAIALASISIVVRRRWLWYGSLACLFAGLAIAAT